MINEKGLTGKAKDIKSFEMKNDNVLVCPVCQFKADGCKRYWKMLVHYSESKHDKQIKYLKK